MKADFDLVQKFISELDKLGAIGKLFGSRVEVVEYISKLVIERKAKLVLTSCPDRELSFELSKAIASAGASCFDVNEVDRHELRKLLEKTDIGITDVDLAVAETGSLVLATKNDAERLLSCLPPIYVAILAKGSIVDRFLELTEWFKKIQGTGTHTISIITGPSRTADIELEIVVGVHGPHELHVIILEEDAR